MQLCHHLLTHLVSLTCCLLLTAPLPFCPTAGGEGSSRPLTAPSSDRSRAMLLQQQQQGGVCQGQGQRSSSPSGRGSGRQAGMRNEHPAVATAIAAEG